MTHLVPFKVVAWVFIGLGIFSALVILLQILRRPQKMWIMNVVWPITGLYMGPLAVYLYYKTRSISGRQPVLREMKAAIERHKADPPTRIQNSIAVFHCGAGCSVGDVFAEVVVPALGLTFAGKFGTRLIVDFLCAYLLGIAFQYFTIVPMGGLSFGKGLIAAARADAISIALFEVGMFAWMGFTYYVLFPAPHLEPSMPLFWFMMQIAMVAGFLTALPANAWLIRKGWKEKMPLIDRGQIRSDQVDQQSGKRMDTAA